MCSPMGCERRAVCWCGINRAAERISLMIRSWPPSYPHQKFMYETCMRSSYRRAGAATAQVAPAVTLIRPSSGKITCSRRRSWHYVGTRGNAGQSAIVHSTGIYTWPSFLHCPVSSRCRLGAGAGRWRQQRTSQGSASEHVLRYDAGRNQPVGDQNEWRFAGNPESMQFHTSA